MGLKPGHNHYSTQHRHQTLNNDPSVITRMWELHAHKIRPRLPAGNKMEYHPWPVNMPDDDTEKTAPQRCRHTIKTGLKLGHNHYSMKHRHQTLNNDTTTPSS